MYHGQEKSWACCFSTEFTEINHQSNQKKFEPYESLQHIINCNKKHNTTVQACFVLHYQPVYVPLTLIFFFPLSQQSQHDLGLLLLLLHEGLHQILLCAQLLSS